MKCSLPIFVLVLLTGCAGHTGGLMSAPYTGDVEPHLSGPDTSYERGQLETLHFDGLDLKVRLNNRVTDYKLEHVLLLPVYVENGVKYSNRDTSRFQAHLIVTPGVPGYTLDPGMISASIDGQTLQAPKVWWEDKEKFSQLSRAYTHALAQPRSEMPPEPQPAEWRLLLETRRELTQPGESYWFVLEFDVPVPDTGQTIIIDLSRALSHPEQPPLAPIHFKQLRWSESRG